MIRRPHWAGELLVVGCLLFVYDLVAGQARVRAGAADAHGRALLGLEHLGLEKATDLWLAGTSWLQAPASYYYDLAHIWVTMVVLVAAWVLRPAIYRSARRALVGINLVGLAVFFVYPVTPPRLLPGSGFVDIVANSHTWGAWEAGGKVAERANELASMPSLHAAWAVWVALTLGAITVSRWRLLGWLHVALTTVVVVVTGNHYLLDVVAGAAVTVLCWRATRGVVRREVVPLPAVHEPALVD